MNVIRRYPTIKPPWRRTGELGVAMKSVSRATWRHGEHLDSAVNFVIVLVMILLDVCLPLRFQFVHHGITRSTHLTTLLTLLTPYSIDPPIHLMVQIQPSALVSAHEPLEFLLFNSLLPIRPSWYHSIDTHHNAPHPAHTVLDRSSLLTPYSIDPPIHLMIQIHAWQSNALLTSWVVVMLLLNTIILAGESLDLLLLNSSLPIRPSRYHSLDTHHNTPLPPHTVLDQSSHPSHGHSASHPARPDHSPGHNSAADKWARHEAQHEHLAGQSPIQCTAYFVGGGNAAAVYNNHGWCGVLLELLVFSFTNLQTTAMSPLLNSSFSYSITEYAMLGRRMETSSALIRIMVMN